jgi:CubicO group peptidase (beta-lactamase class C family)
VNRSRLTTHCVPSRLSVNSTVWLPLILIASMPVCAGALVTEDRRALDALVDTVRSVSSTPLVAVAITTADNVCHASLYGENQEVSANKARPRFHAASISKLLTATVIMQLHSEGKLSSNDLLSSYEQAFAGSPIKLVDLLTHTSGLRDPSRFKALRDQHEVDSYIAALAAQTLASRPGERWAYSDAGYNLLGRVIERTTGQPFADAMRKRVLEPLGMRDSDFDVTRIPAEQRLTAFDRNGKELPHPWDLAYLPSSGLQTTADDLGKFARAILAASARPENALPITGEILREMTQVRTATEWNGIGQGLGWQITNSELGRQWRHAGGERGFESLMTLYPDRGFAIVVLGNRADWPRFELEQKLRALSSALAPDCSVGSTATKR